MVSSKPTSCVLHPDSDCTSMAFIEHDASVLIGMKNGDCTSIRSKNEIFNINWTKNLESEVTCLLPCGKEIIVGTLNHLSVLDCDGNILMQHSLDAGAKRMFTIQGEHFLYDQFGQLFQMSILNSTIEINQIFENIQIEELFPSHLSMFLVDERGQVFQIRQNKIIWQRPHRGTIGERILHIVETPNEDVGICREGHAFVDGEEEVLELEWWNKFELLHRIDLNQGIRTSVLNGNHVYFGCDDGSIIKADSTGVWEQVLQKEHPIQNILFIENQLVFSWWFYISGFHLEHEWIVEHKGLPIFFSFDPHQKNLYFAGTDLNDYTGPEPIGSICISDVVIDIDKSELTTWFEEKPERLDEHSIYEADEDMLQYLTQEEQQQLEQSTIEMSVDGLLGAMQEQTQQKIPDNHDDSSDIFADLLLDEIALSTPTAVAGDDITLKADEDGAAIVHLDASESTDPDGQIDQMTWVDHRGQAISNQFKCAVKLPKGIYRFEFRICDKSGTWSSDSISITILE